MANVKKFIGYTTTGKTVYGIVERQADSYILNDADGTFSAYPADPYISFTEHSVIKGEYTLSESRQTWNDGLYNCTVYEQLGGSPVPASDIVVAYQYMYIVSDAEVVSESKMPMNYIMGSSIKTDKDDEIDTMCADVVAVKVDTAAVKAKTDDLPSGIAKNIALSNFQFFMVLSTNHITPATGKTVTGTISKDGGAFAALTNAISEIGNGMYKVNLTQTEMNADVITLKFTETDCDQRTITVYTT